jgi:hypothetical protein
VRHRNDDAAEETHHAAEDQPLFHRKRSSSLAVSAAPAFGNDTPAVRDPMAERWEPDQPLRAFARAVAAPVGKALAWIAAILFG